MKNLPARLPAASVLSLTLLAWTAAYGQITPSGDAYTSTASPTTNYGAAPLLYVNGASEAAYVQFNLSSIPAGAHVGQATLKLYVNAVTKAGSMNVDYVSGAWVESTITSSLVPALGTTIVSSVPITTGSKNQYVLIDITPAAVGWLNGSVANDGIALVANGTFNANFDSKENTTTSHPAELDIVLAGGGTVTGITTSNGSGLAGGGTSGTLNLSLLKTCAANRVLKWNGNSWACSVVGTGTITGVTAGAGLTGGGTSGSVTLNLNTSNVPLLATANTFTGDQTVNGNLITTGAVTGSSFQIGSNLFAFGSYTNGNAFLGFSGNSTMTATGNTASGIGALLYNTTGNSNTASGLYTLLSNTTGGGNTASGATALYSNTTGGGNTASGDDALFYNTSGVGNTATGFGALFRTSTGSNNTATGVNAGIPYDGSNLTGSNDTAIGTYAAFGTGSLLNATAIGADAIVSESNALVLGCINGVNRCPATTMVGIGTATPSTSLDVVGSLKIEGTGNGITFPDGSSQIAAAAQGPAGPPGPQGPPGPSVHTSAVCASNVLPNLVTSGCRNKTIAFQSVPGGSCNITSDTGSCSAVGASGPNGTTNAVCSVCSPN